MEKKPFVTKEQLDEIVKKYPTPFHLYDEKGIRENAEAVKEAFAWNPGFREYFAVKATPNPFILNILKDYGCGTDCSSLTELMMSDACGFHGHEIMFSSNDTPAEEFQMADRLGAIINLDDLTLVDYLERIPNGYITKKQELIEKLKGMQQAMSSAAGPVLDTNEELPIPTGKGNGALQRAINETGVV